MPFAAYTLYLNIPLSRNTLYPIGCSILMCTLFRPSAHPSHPFCSLLFTSNHLPFHISMFVLHPFLSSLFFPAPSDTDCNLGCNVINIWPRSNGFGSMRASSCLDYGYLTRRRGVNVWRACKSPLILASAYLGWTEYLWSNFPCPWQNFTRPCF